MRIVLFGKNGQLGFELHKRLVSLGELIALGRHEADFENHTTLMDQLLSLRPDVIINAAAFTAVDQAEVDRERVYRINTQAPMVLAEAANTLNAWLVHYSSDYVFDGRRDTPYSEDADTAPLNVYGNSKRAGEVAIAHSGCRHFIFRTSWIYGAYGQNFPKTILKRAMTQTSLQVVSDCLGTPTHAGLIAEVTEGVLSRLITGTNTEGGLYHLTAGGRTSWYAFACFLLELAEQKGYPLRLSPKNIVPIRLRDASNRARRPRYSCFNTQKLTRHFQITLPHWTEDAVLWLNALYPSPAQFYTPPY